MQSFQSSLIIPSIRKLSLTGGTGSWKQESRWNDHDTTFFSSHRQTLTYSLMTLPAYHRKKPHQEENFLRYVLTLDSAPVAWAELHLFKEEFSSQYVFFQNIGLPWKEFHSNLAYLIEASFIFSRADLTYLSPVNETPDEIPWGTRKEVLTFSPTQGFRVEPTTYFLYEISLSEWQSTEHHRRHNPGLQHVQHMTDEDSKRQWAMAYPPRPHRRSRLSVIKRILRRTRPRA